MVQHGTTPHLFRLLRQQKIKWAGHRKLKIYGTLHCRSGKRMKPSNRVFFASEQDAQLAGFRPCAHCLRPQYLAWKEQETG
jgi:methylphosphotriester-DNA--protein-cysteine methyltransferase